MIAASLLLQHVIEVKIYYAIVELKTFYQKLFKY